NRPPTSVRYTLSLHDALPIFAGGEDQARIAPAAQRAAPACRADSAFPVRRLAPDRSHARRTTTALSVLLFPAAHRLWRGSNPASPSNGCLLGRGQDGSYQLSAGGGLAGLGGASHCGACCSAQSVPGLMARTSTKAARPPPRAACSGAICSSRPCSMACTSFLPRS